MSSLLFTSRRFVPIVATLWILTWSGGTLAQSSGLVGSWDDHGKPFWLNGHSPIQVPDAPNFDLPNGSPWTLEAWVYPMGHGAMHVAGKRGGCAGGGGFYQLAVAPNPQGNGMGIDPSYAPNDTWTHIAIVSDGVGWVGYANGRPVHQAYRPRWTIRNRAPFRIGVSGSCAPFVGGLERLALFRRALSPAEIRAEFESHRAEVAQLIPPKPVQVPVTAGNQSSAHSEAPMPPPPPEGPLPASCGDPLKPFPLNLWDTRFTPPPGAAFAADVARGDELFRQKRYAEAGRLYLPAGYAKDPYASRRLGILFLYGLAEPDPSFEAKPDVAAIFFRQAAEKGDVASARALGWMLSQGIGVSQDFGYAKTLFEQGAKNGYSESEIALGVLYIRGDGLAVDHKEAMRWFQRAASHKNPDGWVGVASLYEDGLGVEQSDAEALRLYRRAADDGSAEGARNIARLYEKGVGVQADLPAALCWYRKAAEAGDGDAMNRLAVWLDQQHRYPEALNWFMKAAETGNSDAMYNVGRYNANGIVVPKSNDYESGTWFRRAEILGNAQAARVMQDRRRAVASMLSFTYALITAPDPPPRCYREIHNSPSLQQVPCTAEHTITKTGW